MVSPLNPRIVCTATLPADGRRLYEAIPAVTLTITSAPCQRDGARRARDTRDDSSPWTILRAPSLTITTGIHLLYEALFPLVWQPWLRTSEDERSASTLAPRFGICELRTTRNFRNGLAHWRRLAGLLAASKPYRRPDLPKPSCRWIPASCCRRDLQAMTQIGNGSR